MNFNKFFQSTAFKVILTSLGALIVLLLTFRAGMAIGFRKASFSYQWGENYHRNFAGPRGGFFRNFSGKDYIDAHGIFGQIIKIDGSALVIKDRDNTEKIVLVTDTTTITRFRDTIALTDLKVDDSIVVIGDPNTAGQIEAKLIRIAPPQGKTSPGSFLPPTRGPRGI